MSDNLFETFSVRDFYNAAKEMRYREFTAYCKDVLDKLESLDISKKGFYHDKADTIRRLYQFVKDAEHFVRYDGEVPLGVSDIDLSFMKSILYEMKKRQGLL